MFGLLFNFYYKYIYKDSKDNEIPKCDSYISVHPKKFEYTDFEKDNIKIILI